MSSAVYRENHREELRRKGAAYRARLKTQEPQQDISQDDAIINRFWSKVQVCEHGRVCERCCWLWQGSCFPPAGSLPYGHFWPTSRQHEQAHRFMWKVNYGPIPQGLSVLHNCPGGDNPSCVNPAHLFLGTDLDNTRDKMHKGRARSVRGEAHGRAKLREAEVYALRREGHLLALRYGITVGSMCRILERRRWKHLPEEAPSPVSA